MTDIEPFKLADELEAYAKTQPPRESEYGPLTVTADMLVDEALEDFEYRRDLERAMKRKILLVKVDKPGIWETKKTGRPGEVEAVKARPGVAKVLNLLPFEEALAIYRAG